jgi:hypothetical protein
VAVGHPFDTLKVRLQTQPTVNPIYCECCIPLRKDTIIGMHDLPTLTPSVSFWKKQSAQQWSAVPCSGLPGCSTEDRSVGGMMDDHGITVSACLRTLL